MNLEIKHLTPYLPYGLKMRNKDHKALIESSGKTYFDSHLTSVSKDGNLFIGKREISTSISTPYWKVALKPLSILRDDCINGKCPLDIIMEEYNAKNEDYIIDVDYHTIGGLTIYGVAINSETQISMPFWVYERLFEWHFDVFGLIDTGLAVNIND